MEITKKNTCVQNAQIIQNYEVEGYLVTANIAIMGAKVDNIALSAELANQVSTLNESVFVSTPKYRASWIPGSDQLSYHFSIPIAEQLKTELVKVFDVVLDAIKVSVLGGV